jgi:hypothetical protein
MNQSRPKLVHSPQIFQKRRAFTEHQLRSLCKSCSDAGTAIAEQSLNAHEPEQQFNRSWSVLWIDEVGE